MATNMQTQSIFFVKLPAEIRVIVNRHILCEFRGKGRQLLGALSSCKQMSAELDHELTGAFLRNLTTEINDIEAAWNAELPPFRVTLPTHTEDLKDNEITLEIALPYPAVQSWAGKDILLRTLSFFHEDDYPTEDIEPAQSIRPASRLPVISLVEVPGSTQLRVRVPRAQKVTLIMDDDDSFENVYRCWHDTGHRYLKNQGYDRELEDSEGHQITLVHHCKKAWE